MMLSVLALAALSLPGVLAAAHPRWDYTSYTGPPNALCTRKSYTIHLPTYPTVPWAPFVSANPNQTVVTSLFQRYVTAPLNFTAAYNVDGMTEMPVSHHALSGVLCVPKAGDMHMGTVQLLVHGIGFDSGYWDFPYMPEMYSYVQAAAAKGYTTFRYDRLGTGMSEHPGDGYRTVQAPTDLAILTAFTALLRSGGVGGTSFSKIVAIGHSYGSDQLAALSAQSPTAVDALILQGFSANASYLPQFLTSTGYSLASAIFPSRFGDLPSSYLVTGLPQTGQMNFFYFPYYDPGAVMAARELEEPVTQGVLLTFAGLSGPSTFKGPVHVVTGDRDWIFCGDQCNIRPPPGNLTILELVGPTVFAMSSDFSAYSPAETGHALNLHLSAPDTYKDMLAWIGARF